MKLILRKAKLSISSVSSSYSIKDAEKKANNFDHEDRVLDVAGFAFIAS
jgi:hypothetical protein